MRWRWRHCWPTSRLAESSWRSGRSAGRQAAAFRRQGQAGHLSVHARRAVAGRYVRSQAAADQGRRQAFARNCISASSGTCWRRPGNSRSTAQSGLDVSELFPHTATMRRRPVRDPLDGHRRSESSRRLPADEHRRAGLFAAEPGRLGHLRTGEREPESARLRGDRAGADH